MRHLILLAVSEHDLEFFSRLVHFTPNLNRLSIYSCNLFEIIHLFRRNSCELLQKCIYQLEIHLDYYWSSVDIHRDIPKLLQTFSNIKSLTIFLHSSQNRSIATVREIVVHLLRHRTNMICINISGNLLTRIKQILKEGGLELIRLWLIQSGDFRFKCRDYFNKTIHIEWGSSSLTIWL